MYPCSPWRCSRVGYGSCYGEAQSQRNLFRMSHNIVPTMRFDIEDSDPPDPRLFTHLNKCFIVILSEINWKTPKSRRKLLEISDNFKEYPLFVIVIHISKDSEFGIHKNLEYPVVELSMEEVMLNTELNITYPLSQSLEGR